jgi:uncharacterized protein
LTEVVIDTNVLIFDIFENSEFHNEASNGLDTSEKWNVPSIVFHELIMFLRSREIPIARANSKVKEYLTNAKAIFMACTADDILFSISRVENYRNYDDFLILSIAKRLDLPLFTFDNDLKKAAVKFKVPVFEIPHRSGPE